MPEVRSGTWSTVQSFPAPDGSRTLRVTLPEDVVDSLQTRVLRGVRVSYLWVRPAKNLRKLMTETELLTSNGTWVKLEEWRTYRGKRESFTGEVNYFQLPALIIDHLKCGRINSIKQILVADPNCISRIHADVYIETKLADGTIQKESLKEYMLRESAVVEMCVPLSSEESAAFFTGDTIVGIRHTWTDDSSEHHVAIANDMGEWVPLTSNEVFIWNRIVTPHFKFISISADRRKDHTVSSSPFL